jgi:hypothetical protein
MPTLGEMKAHIADDLDDTSSTYATQIARAITRAIEHYKKTRFAFNESRTIEITTVIDQSVYAEADDTDIPAIIKMDGVFLIDLNGQITSMQSMTPQEMEILIDNSASSGEPYAYSYYAKTLRVYPIPDAAYTIRIQAWYRLDAPSLDADENAWTEEAYDLIKSRALFYVATHSLQDEPRAMAAKRDELEAEDALTREMNNKNGTGFFTPTSF